MIDKDLEKLHRIEKEILQRFVLLCEEHNIKYYVIGGTLIGAVRHGGFIPWDDDIDIAVPRDDYDRLIKLMHGLDDDVLGMEYYRDDSSLYFYPIRITHKKYFISEPRNKDGKSHPWIDILPIDGLPDSRAERSLFKAKMTMYRALLGLHYVDNLRDIDRSSVQKAVIRFGKISHAGRLIDPTRIKDKIDATLRKNKMQDCRESGTCMGAYFFHEFTDSTYFGDGTKVSFEGLEVNAPEKIDPYLTHMYGDYMTLPPEEKRASHDVRFV